MSISSSKHTNTFKVSAIIRHVQLTSRCSLNMSNILISFTQSLNSLIDIYRQCAVDCSALHCTLAILQTEEQGLEIEHENPSTRFEPATTSFKV